MSDRILGILLVTISALVFSTAGLFVKLVSAGSWEVIFWRGMFSVGFSLIYVLWRQRFKLEVSAMGRSGVFIGLVGAAGTAAFVPAFKMTTIANVTLIYAAAPVIAALLAFVFVGEKIARTTVIAICLAFAGVLVIVSGTLGGVHLIGDFLALVMTFNMAVIMVLYRAYPNTPAAGPAMLSSGILIGLALVFASPFAIDFAELPVLALFGLIFAVASITLAEGAKRISAGQTALLSVMETPLAPLLAWLVLTEIPPMTTFVGGSLVFLAVICGQISTNSAR